MSIAHISIKLKHKDNGMSFAGRKNIDRLEHDVQSNNQLRCCIDRRAYGLFSRYVKMYAIVSK